MMQALGSSKAPFRAELDARPQASRQVMITEPSASPLLTGYQSFVAATRRRGAAGRLGRDVVRATIEQSIATAYSDVDDDAHVAKHV